MARIFVFDIETAPLTAHVWGRWKQNVGYNQLLADWHMLTWAGKWLGDDDVVYDSVHLHGEPHEDRPIIDSLASYLDEADIVVAHNGNKFDIKKFNTRMAILGIEPPSPYRKIDTLREAQKNFAFTSNRLGDLGDLLGVGDKVDTGGFELWTKCLQGDKEAFEKMIEYNVQDVVLLEKVYLKLRPWMTNHPNLAVYNDEEETQCPKCGGTHLHWRGYATTQVSRFRRFRCLDCGGWGRERIGTGNMSKTKRQGVATNAQ